jgi:hypothetical protein
MDTGTGDTRFLSGSEWAAVLLLPLGGFLVGIGWFIGVALLWRSPAWTHSEKLIGMLVPVGGLVCPLWLVGRISGSVPVLWGTLIVLVFLAALLVPLWLVVQARHWRVAPTSS